MLRDYVPGPVRVEKQDLAFFGSAARVWKMQSKSFAEDLAYLQGAFFSYGIMLTVGIAVLETILDTNALGRFILFPAVSGLVAVVLIAIARLMHRSSDSRIGFHMARFSLFGSAGIGLLILMSFP